MQTNRDNLAVVSETQDLEDLAEQKGELSVEVLENGHLRVPSRVKAQLGLRESKRAEALHTGPGWSIFRSLSEDLDSAPRGTDNNSEVVVAGSIGGAGLSVIDFIGCLGPGRQTGVLTASKGRTQRSIYFYHGDIVWASTSVPDERLGSFLVRRGKITEEQLQTALSDRNKRVGQACVDRGFLAAHELWAMVQSQLTDIFDKVLAAKQGIWTFSRVSTDILSESRIHLSTQGLLMDALSRLDEMQLYRDVVPSSEHIISLCDSVTEQLDDDQGLAQMLETLEARSREDAVLILKSVGSGATTHDLIRVLGRGEFELTRALYHLIRAKLVTVTSNNETGPIAPRSIDDSIVDAAGLVQAYSLAIREMFQELQSIGKREDLYNASSTLLRENSGPHADLLMGATILPEGGLDQDGMLVMAQFQGADVQKLNEALGELLHFVLFQAAEYLGQRRGDDLGRRVKAILMPLARSGDATEA